MPSAKVIPLAARAPTPWKAAAAHNPRQAQAQVQHPDRQTERQQPKAGRGRSGCCMESVAQISFSSITLTCTCRTDSGQRTDGQADRHAKLCGVLMWIRYSWPFPTTPTHFTAPLVTTRTPFLGWALCLSLWYVWLAMWILHGRERERTVRGQAGKGKREPEYCKIQYLGNDACADSCVQNVTGNAIRCEQRITQRALRLAISTIFQLNN